MDLIAPLPGRVAALPFSVGDALVASDPVVVLEVMKMEHTVPAGRRGVLAALSVSLGDQVEKGQPLARIEASVDDGGPVLADEDQSSGDSLREVYDRHALLADDARPDAVQARHRTGHRTVRENLADLCDDFVEYGGLAIAAQRGRRDLDDLIRRTPADGMVGGIGRIGSTCDGADRAIVVSYDFTVLAGTQGALNHRKKDRLFTLAAETGWPVVLFAEGGGGRPGDVDWPGVSLLDVSAFRLFAEIPGATIGVNAGFCFAGNAALLGQCDVIVATSESNLGMGGPAMVEGGGLGSFAPEEIGPSPVQAANGVIDIEVEGDIAAVATVKQLLGLIQCPLIPGEEPDQEALRRMVPPNRRRLYDMRELIRGVLDDGSFLELRRDWAPSAITGFGRLAGRPLGVIANDPSHLAGAIDSDAAVSFRRHLELCDKWGFPVLSFCDTPGFMVGPEAEAAGLVRSAGSLFRAAAALRVPTGTVVTRRGYGLGAMAMSSGGFHEGRFTIGWPDSEFGAMGIEGAVKLGFRQELESIEAGPARDQELQRRIDEMYEEGRGLNVASHFEIDDVIDPAETRRWVIAGLF